MRSQTHKAQERQGRQALGASVQYANAKFERRFRFIEEALAEQGRDIEQASLEEMDSLWEQAKQAERECDSTKKLF